MIMQNGNETVLKLVEEDYNKIFDLMCISIHMPLLRLHHHQACARARIFSQRALKRAELAQINFDPRCILHVCVVCRFSRSHLYATNRKYLVLNSHYMRASSRVRRE